MKRGFTLIELLVVISIISLLSSIVVTSVNSARVKAEVSAGLTFEDNIYKKLYNCLIAQYDFEDENNLEKDSSGYNNDGNNNGVSSAVGVNGGKAAEFDADSDVIETAELDQNPSEETLSLWFYPEGSGRILAEENNGGYTYTKVGINNNLDLVTNVWSCNSSTPITPGKVLLNQWNHLALSYGNGKMFSYLNGSDYAEFSCSRSAPNRQFIKIGRGSGQSAGGFDSGIYFKGKIDNARFFNCAL